MQYSYKYVLKPVPLRAQLVPALSPFAVKASIYFWEIYCTSDLTWLVCPRFYLPEELNRVQNTGWACEPVRCYTEPALNLLLQGQLAQVQLVGAPPLIPRATWKPKFCGMPNHNIQFLCSVQAKLVSCSCWCCFSYWATLNFGPEGNSTDAAVQNSRSSQAVLSSDSWKRNAAWVVLTFHFVRHHQSATRETTPLL